MTRRNLNTALAASLLVSLAACSKPADSGKPAATSSQPRAVRAAAAEVRPMERAVTVTGLLLADEDATLSVKIGGRLRSLSVDLGSLVKRGDVIAQVEPRDYELRLQQAAAALAQARATVGLSLEGADDTFDPEKTSAVKEARAVLDEATHNRDRVLKLSDQGVLSKSEFDTVEAGYKVAVNRLESAREEASTRQAVLAQRRAEFDLAKQQLSDTSLRSPFDGSIQSRLANVGEFLPAGSPVVKLVKIDPLRLRLEVPDRDAAAVRLNQPVRLSVGGDTNHYTGTLTRVSPAIDEQSRMLVVEADVHNDGTLRPGLIARAQIIVRADDSGLAVPASALVDFAGLEKIIIVQQGKALERVVKTGRRSADWVEIKSGLAAGDLAVLEPGNLRTGETVAVTAAPVARPSLSSSNRPDANAR
jgi:RND family efflux transporter MFP subunit